MTMATVKAPWGKPIWMIKGGAELAVPYGTIALAVGLAGPGA
jgi:putative oxidoreductase